MNIVERTINNSTEPNIATIQKDDSVWFLNGLRHREEGLIFKLQMASRHGIYTVNFIAKMALLLNLKAATMYGVKLGFRMASYIAKMALLSKLQMVLINGLLTEQNRAR